MQTTNVIGAPSASPFSALVMMFHSPGAAFALLEHRRAAWLPLILLMASTTALMWWYFAAVDYPWLSETMAAAAPTINGEKPPPLSRGTMQAMTLPVTLLSVPFFAALSALYYLIVGKVSKREMGFGKGFALSLWASVPGLLLFVLGAMQIMLAADGRLAFSGLNPVSLNQLLFHVDMGNPWSSWLDSLNLFTIWSLILNVIGYQVWTKSSRATAVKVVVISYIVSYGAWAAINLMSKAA